MSDELNRELPLDELEKIERYLVGEMDEKERILFEQRVEQEPLLKTEVEHTRVILRSIETGALAKKMEEFHSSLPPGVEVTPKTDIPWARYGMAAAIIMLAITTGWFLLKEDPNQQLYKTYFQADPGLITPMSSQSDYPFYEGMVAYKSTDYSRAIGIWEDLREEKPNNDTLNFYLGVSHLAKGDPITALTYLDQAKRVGDGVFIQEIHYFIGMAYLKNGDRESAITAFQYSGLDESTTILKALTE